VFNIFGLFGWNRKVRKLRKRWDRAREKTLKKKNPEKKMLLEKLDSIEEKLRTIEEESNLNRGARAKIAKEVEIDLEEVKEILKSKDEELVVKQ
jgi:hypothetical protein